MKHPKTPPSRGFSLIEMLVGILIISFGLLGLITLQARALQASTTNEDSQRAALLANEMAALMINANSVNLDAATVVKPWAARASDPASGGMPSGNGEVTVNGNTARITMTWKPTGTTGDANDNYRYVTTVVIPQ
ncbi:prepilin-type N-terminal cleavage/methylation domain-containing protein [Pelomonas sp. Root1444]|uniref:Type IV pilus assembly protein PilV n=1 Tax=Pelomonas aquatica TaxID=431058 RepID=A0ABU1ZDC1_9BURK|nr:prepilin-type N-terminal cleavage/methylation domain-containing protein [Pelomonas sp. Root1444]KQY89032.1 hypothetical protein ASD35_16090 [Pelomonas sp. Root1444]MDR7297990.1 type IV pilus assembly protein PilV [Pelomonas aquatica]